METNNAPSQNKAEALAKKPIRWSVATVAVALMCALFLHSTVQGVYSTLSYYKSVISSQQISLIAAAGSATINRQNRPKNQAPQETNRIIVKYKEGANLPPGLTIAAERANLERAQGLVKVLTINGINAEVYEVSGDDTAQEVINRLLTSARDLIEYAEVDIKVALDLIPNDPSYGSQWHHPVVQTPAAWDSTKGEGVVIAIADTGVDCTHPDLAASCVPGWNTASNNNNTADVQGHGTAVAGTAAQIGDNAVGAAGIAHQAKIMPVRVTDSSDGYAYFSAIASAVTWAADNGARIVNASYGACGASSVANAADYMRSKGGVVIISAGNTGADGGFVQSDKLTCVSATASDDTRTSWSSFGQYVDVAAPGAGIYTTVRGGGYGNWNGTSFSAPLVAGIYALMFSANPNLTPQQADNILFSTVDDIGVPGWDMYYGHGRVNAFKAVQAALATMGNQDVTPPTVPGNLRTTSVTSNSVSLAWNPSSDTNSGVAGYSVFQNNVKVATVAGTTYTRTGLTPNTAYSYTVAAEDVAGNVSAQSGVLSVTTPDVSFSIVNHSVPVKTNTTASVATTLTKPGTVTVRYGRSAGSLTLNAVSTATSSTTHRVDITALTAGTTYYYQVVATDGATTVTSPVSSFKTSKGGGKPTR